MFLFLAMMLVWSRKSGEIAHTEELSGDERASEQLTLVKIQELV